MTQNPLPGLLTHVRTRHFALGAALLLLAGTAATVIATRPLDKACQGQAVTPGADLVELVNGTTDATFCLAPGTGVTAAGIKSARSFEVTSSYVHDNQGVGVWADIRAERLVVAETVVVNNELAGVRWEHDKRDEGSSILARNVIQSNKGGGVAIDSASNADITGNMFGGNTDAVTVEEDKNPVFGIAVYGNILGPEADPSITPDQLTVCDDTTVICFNNAETGTLPLPEPTPTPEPSITPEPS